MRVVVTGGAGFIGSHFVRSLVSGGLVDCGLPHDPTVLVLDALTYAGHVENLAPVADRVELVVGDVTDRSVVDRVLEGADLVVHFAAESHVDRSIEGAEVFVRTNVLGTQVLLDAAVRRGTGRFVHVSTDEVYGTIATGSWPETDPVQPNSPYSATKAGSDLLVRAYHRTHGLDCVITRCSNNYGPYQTPEKVIPLFVTNLLDGLPVPLYGDGRNMRDWLHVDDHCRGVALAATRGRAGEVYNLGGGTELTTRELTARILQELAAGPELVEQVTDRKGHDLRYSVDVTKARTELGYAPRTAFDNGLRETVAWYREHRSWWEPIKAATASGR